MDERQRKKDYKLFLWTFLIALTFGLILGLIVGAHSGTNLIINIFISTIFALVSAGFLTIIYSVIYSGARRGQQIRNIIDAKDKEIKQRRKIVGIEKNPMTILKERYAKGEISKEQYDEMKSDLID